MEKDRISALPGEIRTHILSLLPIQEAIATSVLSRAWRDLWINLPSLDLMSESYYSNVLEKKLSGFRGEIDETKIHTETVLAFLDVLHQTLTKWSSNKLQSCNRSAEFVHLYFPPVSLDSLQEVDATCLLDRLLECAIKDAQVKQLRIRCGLFRETDFSHLHISLPNKQFLGASSLRELWLYKIILEPELVQVLATNCPLLTTLEFCNCYLSGGTLMKVSGLSKLVELRLVHVFGLKKLKITHAPNLSHLEAKATYSDRISASINVKDCQKLKHVTIHHAILSQNCHLINQLPNLEYLHLYNFEVVQRRLHISSNRLKCLILQNCHNVVEVKIDAPSLQGFCCSVVDKVEIDAPQLTSLTCDVVSSFVVYTDFSSLEKASFSLGCTDAQFLEILKSLNQPNNLELSIGNSLFEQNYSQNQDIPPVLYGVKNLKFNLFRRSKLPRHRVSEIFDALLWLSPHPETISIPLWVFTVTDQWIQHEIKILQFKYKAHSDGEEECFRCKSLPIRCWQHCLQEVRIENQIVGSNLEPEVQPELTERRVADDTYIKAFFQNSTTAEKIVVNIVTLLDSKTLENQP